MQLCTHRTLWRFRSATVRTTASMWRQKVEGLSNEQSPVRRGTLGAYYNERYVFSTSLLSDYLFWIKRPSLFEESAEREGGRESEMEETTISIYTMYYLYSEFFINATDIILFKLRASLSPNYIVLFIFRPHVYAVNSRHWIIDTRSLQRLMRNILGTESSFVTPSCPSSSWMVERVSSLWSWLKWTSRLELEPFDFCIYIFMYMYFVVVLTWIKIVWFKICYGI